MEAYEDFAHIGPDSLAGKHLRQFWQPLCAGDDLQVGRPKRVQVLNEWFTAYRGQDGKAHVVQDACPHRQTKLYLGWVEGADIRCFYHGWKFNPEGKCVEQPAENEAFKHKVSIKGYPTREYLGFVFAYFGEGAAPEFPMMPEVDVEKDTVFYNVHPVPCNYFQRIENDMDELHLHFVHKVSTDDLGLVEFPDVEVSETEFGILRKGKRKNEAGQNVNRTAYWMMPNVLLTFVPSKPFWTMHLAWRVPIADDKMCSFIISAHKGAGGGLKPRAAIDPSPDDVTADVLEGRIRVQDLDPNYAGLFQVQDNVALAGQGSMVVDRTIDRLGQSDKGVIFLRKLYERELRAIAEGHQPKIWKRPATSFFTERTRELELANALAAE
jgi:5,5'-dehydrodivanillate O-demethylase